MSDHEREDLLSKPMVPPPRGQEQAHCTNDNKPSSNLEQIGLPHGWRKHDYRSANQQAEGLLCIVRSCRTCEGCEEAFSDDRLCKGKAREPDEEEAEHHDDYCSKYTHYHDKRYLLWRRERLHARFRWRLTVKKQITVFSSALRYGQTKGENMTRKVKSRISPFMN
jgi:hypothetical protein